jgi:DNA-binding transcriptional LysR family regulator
MEELEGLAFDEDALVGEVIVGCFEDLAPYCAPALLHRLKARHPHIRATVCEESFQALGRKLAEGAIDIALTYNIALPPDVEVQVLRTLEPYALLPADHPLTRSKSVSLAELARYSLVLSDQEDSWKYILGLFQLHDLSPSVLGKMRSFEMQRSMVANGFGVAIAYTSPFGDYAYDGKPLVHRPIADGLPLQQILVAYVARRPLSRAARGFILEAQEWFSSNGADTGRAQQSDHNVQQVRRKV